MPPIRSDGFLAISAPVTEATSLILVNILALLV